ncbi:MAG: hypothetical protein LBG58_05235 [Planctomycetaceae bacterium]|jgi:hypothetical protein|nr:hypothetical protein [Planctomycetaceae bacterium]
MNYAEKLIRGISNADFIDSEGRATAMLFQFDNVNTRQDGFCECSINWYDNEEALKLLLEQKKREDENIYQFKTGAAILLRCWLDDIINRPNCKDALKYERAEITENPYHGNLLRKNGLTKQINNMLAASIAMCVEKIEYREKIPKQPEKN